MVLLVGAKGFTRTGAGALLACLLTLPGASLADVRTSTETRAYRVGGATAASLVSFMRAKPFRGARGKAISNITPSYGLDIATRLENGVCRASKVTLDMRFVMTLPEAESASAMSSGTQSAWHNFVGFCKKHEETHMRIYVQCGNTFVAKAERLTAPNCTSLQTSIRNLLESEKRACDRKQIAFDNADYKRIFGLSLFKLAGAPSRSR